MSQLKMSFFYVIGNDVTYDIKKVLAKANTLRLKVFADIMMNTEHEHTHFR